MYLILAVVASVSLAFAGVDEKDKPAEPQNELISDFVDNPGKYKGKTITLQLVWRGGAVGQTLRDVQGEKGTLFVGNDPKNDAKLAMNAAVPAKLMVPAAKYKEEVIITFYCADGKTDKGNTATAVRRP